MSTTAERINNAILALDWNVPAEPAGVRASIAQLAVHWVSYWNSAERRLAPPLTQTAKLQRYAAWYARGWALVPEQLRATLVHPRDVDATVWSAIEDQLTYTIEGNEAAARLAAKGAEQLSRELRNTSTALLKGLLLIAGGATVVLLAYGYARRPVWR